MPLLFFSSSGKTRDILLPVCSFFVFLMYFVFGAGWLEPARLVLHGQTLDIGSTIAVRWDSGAGFNKYEQRLIQPNIRPQDGKINITIGATGRSHPASLSKKMVCAAVLVDGKEINLQNISGKLTVANNELHFDKHDAVSFTVQANSHVIFRFRTDNRSGVAFVIVNGTRHEYDLYMANEAAQFQQIAFWLLRADGTFTAETALPRYPVQKLEILNVRPERPVRFLAAEVHGKGTAIKLPHEPVELGRLSFDHPLDGMKSYFHPLQFVQQLFFAVLSAWLLTSLFRRVAEIGSLRGMFFEEQRQWFWLIFAACLMVFSTWLVAFWPGVISVDSMKIWRAALLPDVYLNDHPLLNVILYKYLRHFWSNPTVVPVFQIFLTSLLLAWFGFWMLRQRVSKIILLFWLFFMLSSVSIGVYNVVLWKDIPFALLVVFWACTLTQLRHGKQQHQLRWTGQRICALLLLGFALGLIRHNGLVYLTVLPLLFLLLGLLPLKKAVPSLAALLLVVGIAFAGLHLSGKTERAGFLAQELRKYTAKLSAHDITKDAKRTMQEYMTVLDINQKHQKWDKFHYYFHDRQAWWFLLRSEWWDVYPYQKSTVPFSRLNKAALQLYEHSYQQPWVWLSWNPVWLLALLPLLTMLFFVLPNTAVLGVMLLAGALPLVYLRIFNWRYYYFLYFGLLFLPAFVSLDVVRWRNKSQTQRFTFTEFSR